MFEPAQAQAAQTTAQLAQAIADAITAEFMDVGVGTEGGREIARRLRDRAPKDFFSWLAA